MKRAARKRSGSVGGPQHGSERIEIAAVLRLGAGQDNAGSFQIVLKAIEELSKATGPDLAEDLGLDKGLQIFHKIFSF